MLSCCLYWINLLHATYGKKGKVMVTNLSSKKGSFRRVFLTFFSRNVEMTQSRKKREGFARNRPKKVWVSPQETIDIHLEVALNSGLDFVITYKNLRCNKCVFIHLQRF